MHTQLMVCNYLLPDAGYESAIMGSRGLQSRSYQSASHGSVHLTFKGNLFHIDFAAKQTILQYGGLKIMSHYFSGFCGLTREFN